MLDAIKTCDRYYQKSDFADCKKQLFYDLRIARSTIKESVDFSLENLFKYLDLLFTEINPIVDFISDLNNHELNDEQNLTADFLNATQKTYFQAKKHISDKDKLLEFLDNIIGLIDRNDLDEQFIYSSFVLFDPEISIEKSLSLDYTNFIIQSKSDISILAKEKHIPTEAIEYVSRYGIDEKNEETELIKIAKSGSMEEFKRELINLENNGKIVNQKDSQGNTALMYLVQRGDKRFFIECGDLILQYMDLNISSKREQTPLTYACSKLKKSDKLAKDDLYQIALFLINNGADIEKTDVLDFGPLMYSLDKPELLEALLAAGAYTENFSLDGTPLMSAVKYGYKKSVDLLLQYNANPSGHPWSKEIVWEKLGVPKGIQKDQYWAPEVRCTIELAAHNGNFAILKKLIEKGAKFKNKQIIYCNDFYDASNDVYFNSLRLALRYGQADLAKKVLELDINKDHWNMDIVFGDAYFFEQHDFIRYLYSKGIKPSTGEDFWKVYKIDEEQPNPKSSYKKLFEDTKTAFLDTGYNAGIRLLNRWIDKKEEITSYAGFIDELIKSVMENFDLEIFNKFLKYLEEWGVQFNRPKTKMIIRTATKYEKLELLKSLVSDSDSSIKDILELDHIDTPSIAIFEAINNGQSDFTKKLIDAFYIYNFGDFFTESLIKKRVSAIKYFFEKMKEQKFSQIKRIIKNERHHKLRESVNEALNLILNSSSLVTQHGYIYEDNYQVAVEPLKAINELLDLVLNNKREFILDDEFIEKLINFYKKIPGWTKEKDVSEIMTESLCQTSKQLNHQKYSIVELLKFIDTEDLSKVKLLLGKYLDFEDKEKSKAILEELLQKAIEGNHLNTLKYLLALKSTHLGDKPDLNLLLEALVARRKEISEYLLRYFDEISETQIFLTLMRNRDFHFLKLVNQKAYGKDAADYNGYFNNASQWEDINLFIALTKNKSAMKKILKNTNEKARFEEYANKLNLLGSPLLGNLLASSCIQKQAT